jgi:replication factor A1
VASEPVIEEGARIRHWYDTQGAKSVFRAKTAVGAGSAPPFSKAEALCLSDIKESGLGMGAASDSFSTQATIVHIREDRLYYPACTSSGCNKKVIMDGETWHCGKCDTRVQVPDHRHVLYRQMSPLGINLITACRYNISMVVADWSDKTWLQGWNEVGIAMFGMTANELHAIKVR